MRKKSHMRPLTIAILVAAMTSLGCGKVGLGSSVPKPVRDRVFALLKGKHYTEDTFQKLEYHEQVTKPTEVDAMNGLVLTVNLGWTGIAIARDGGAKEIFSNLMSAEAREFKSGRWEIREPERVLLDADGQFVCEGCPDLAGRYVEDLPYQARRRYTLTLQREPGGYYSGTYEGDAIPPNPDLHVSGQVLMLACSKGSDRLWMELSKQRPCFATVLQPEGREHYFNDSTGHAGWDLVDDQGGIHLTILVPERIAKTGRITGVGESRLDFPDFLRAR